MLKCSVKPHWNAQHQRSHKFQYSFFTSFFPLVNKVWVSHLEKKDSSSLPSYSFLLLHSPPLPLTAKYPEFPQSCHSHFPTSHLVPIHFKCPSKSQTWLPRANYSQHLVMWPVTIPSQNSPLNSHAPLSVSFLPAHHSTWASFPPGSCFTSCPMLGFPKLLFSTVFTLYSGTHNYGLYFPYHLGTEQSHPKWCLRSLLCVT